MGIVTNHKSSLDRIESIFAVWIYTVSNREWAYYYSIILFEVLRQYQHFSLILKLNHFIVASELNSAISNLV